MIAHTANRALGLPQKIWQKLCFLFVIAFYRKVEVSGADKLNNQRPVILCANHANALADAVLLQYTSTRLIHPLARSGLFKNPLLKIVLNIWQAVPVYRQQDDANQVSRDRRVDNDAMFNKAYDMLAKNEVLMIFPEGQSHSDLHLRQIKTGVARIVLGYKQRTGVTPLVIPVGMNFTHRVKFRSNVYINFGDALAINEQYKQGNKHDIKNLTQDIMSAMQALVLEADEVDDLVFVHQVERFFALRQKKIRKRNLSQKFKSHKLLLSVKAALSLTVPDKLDAFKRHLQQFNRLCHKLGINDYNLNVHYNSGVIRRFVFRSVFFLLVLLPLGIFGFISSWLPYLLTNASIKVVAKGKDQYDTSKIMLGSVYFSVFWCLQVVFVYYTIGLTAALAYWVLLIPSGLTALIMLHEQAQIIDNVSVFIVLLKRANLRRYLLKKRKGIEKELAALIKLARNNQKKN